MADVGKGDFLTSLDGLLGEEDLDLAAVIITVGSVRNAGVVDARQAQADDLEERKVLSSRRISNSEVKTDPSRRKTPSTPKQPN